MKKFEIFRYLKKFSILILLIAFLGTFATYLYVDGRQQYTANITIQYTNSAIDSGLTPAGTKLDVNEIYSSAVISQAMEMMGSNGPLNIIRSRCSVQEIIPADQKTINEALLGKGEPVTYFPDTYKVSLVVDSNYGARYARNALDAIMQSYCTYYTENYVEDRLSLNPSTNLLQNGYEYYQCIRMLENDTQDMLEFLKKKKDNYPDFRSSKTGYSYADLYDIYKEFNDYTIPELYGKVLDGPQVKDGDILREYLANQITESNQTEHNKSDRRALIKKLIDNYVERNKGIMGGSISDDEDYVQSILRQIEESGSGEKAITTYDSLILSMIDIDKNVASEQIERAFLQEISTAFGEINSGSSGTKQQHEELEKLINDYEGQLTKYYEIVKEASKELNLSISADYLKMLSSVRVYPALNAKMYLTIAVVLFLLIGVAGSIFLGRIGDIIDYLLYVDKKTKLPNRDKINDYVDDYAGKILPENYSCFAFRLVNLSEITKRYGYTVGDAVLKDFSDLVKSLFIEEGGFVGYNGIGNYNAFYEHCSRKKADVMLYILQQQVKEYNELNPEYPIHYKAGVVVTSEVGDYQIRNLLRLASEALKNSEIIGDDEPMNQKDSVNNNA